MRCMYCEDEKPSLKSVRSHERLCKANPNRSLTPFQDRQWQLDKGTNQFLKAEHEGKEKPSCSAETRKKISAAVRSRPKKPNCGTSAKFRLACSFRFNVYDYPEEFDLSLIELHKWYSAANRGNNLNGVSRDHMLSVKYAYDNGIDPSIISHPANCKLLLHSDNASKQSKCSLNLSELLERISTWNEKYNTNACVYM